MTEQTTTSPGLQQGDDGHRLGFGVDIGGSGIKGAPVDLEDGSFRADRVRVDTPSPSTPAAVADVVAEVVAAHGWTGRVGCTFPAPIVAGRAVMAANVDPEWVGADVSALVSARLGVPVTTANDADAAGLAEVRYGAARGVRGVVLLLTFGTGIGSALFTDGRLVPNTELGHLQLDGCDDAETVAAASARTREDLGWEEWARDRVSPYLRHVERLFWPELLVLGGGVSRKSKKWFRYLECETPVVAAAMTNDAGITGAALLAERSGDTGETHAQALSDS